MVGLQATLAQSERIFEPFLSDREWAISIVDDPTGLAPAPLVQKFQLRSGDCSAKPPYDDCKANTERASLAEPISPQSRSGVNQWLRWQMYIPEDFESSYPAKNRLGEFNDHRGQETPWVLEIGSTGVLWLGRRLDDDEEYFSLVDAELLKGEWIEVVLQVRWSRKAGEFKLWVNGDARVDFKGPTCTRCDMFFSYGLSRVEIDKFRKRYPAKPLPTQTVFFTPVETAAKDPGWIPIPSPVIEITPTEENAKPSAGEEAAPEVEATETPSPGSTTLEEGADTPSEESGVSSGDGAAIIILEGEEVESSEKSQLEASTSQEPEDSNANPEPTVESVSETSVSGPSETLEPIVDPNIKDK
ncbi:MAG: heparin lyase I family protein [Halieaceae bacterium]